MRRLRKLQSCVTAILKLREEKENPIQRVNGQFYQNKFPYVKKSKNPHCNI